LDRGFASVAALGIGRVRLLRLLAGLGPALRGSVLAALPAPESAVPSGETTAPVIPATARAAPLGAALAIAGALIALFFRHLRILP